MRLKTLRGLTFKYHALTSLLARDDVRYLTTYESKLLKSFNLKEESHYVAMSKLLKEYLDLIDSGCVNVE